MNGTDSSRTAPMDRLSQAILVQLLVLGVGFSFYAIDRFLVPVALKDIGTTFNFSVVQIGALGTSFLLGQSLVDIPTGYLADRVSLRSMFFGSLLGMGATLICFVQFSSGFWTALFWRVAFGCTEGVFNICLFTFAGAILPRRRAFINNMMGAFYGIGGLIGPTAYGFFIRSTGHWQVPLELFAAGTIAWAFVVLVSFRLQGPETAALDRRRPLPAEDTLGRAIRRLSRVPGFWLALTIPLLNLVSQWGYGGLGAYLLTSIKHVDSFFSGSVIAFAFGLGPLAAPFIGYLADRWGRKYVIVALALVLIAALLVMFVSSVSAPLILLLCAFFVGVGTNTIYWLGYTVVQDTVPSAYIGLATGVTGALGYLLASSSGVFIGMITDAMGYSAAIWIVLIVPDALVIVCAFAFLPPKPSAVAHVEKLA